MSPNLSDALLTLIAEMRATIAEKDARIAELEQLTAERDTTKKAT